MSEVDGPLQVVGAGPAGMSLVLALCNRVAAAGAGATRAQDLLDGMQIFEIEPSPGGNMGRYRINANTSARDAVQGIRDGTPFAGLRDSYLEHPKTRNPLIPLPQIAALMVEPLARQIADFLGPRLHCRTRVARIEVGTSGFTSFDCAGQKLSTSENLLFCCGAREKPLPELESRADRWEGSSQFLMRDQLEGLSRGGSIVIVGASHSAFSCAWRLLYDPLFSEFTAARELFVLQRRPRIKLRCTPEFAAAHGVEFDPVADICPATGLVFRNGGLRKDAKQLFLDIRRGVETRVKLVKMNALADQQVLLDRAGLILQATGFAPNLPRIEHRGKPLAVGEPSLDGELCNLVNGEPIAGLFGMGLGLNILPHGAARGEPSFHGGIHGFQSYPLAIAPRVIDKMLARMPTAGHT